MERSFALTNHPSTPTDAVDRIEARLRRNPGGVLAVTFSLQGDLARVRIPDTRPRRMTDHLWQHTCFEVFIGVDGTSAYHEFNLSPSGEWMAHAFQRYRQGGPLADETLAPQIRVSRSDHGIELEAVIELDRLSADYAGAQLRIGPCTVVEETNAALSYWSVRHPSGKPDFHHLQVFAVQLAAPDVDAGRDPR